MGKSMLNRKEYVVGGLTKALIPVVKRVAKVFKETDSEKEIKNRVNKIIDKIENAPLGSSKKETFKKIAEEEDVTLGFVKDADKINSYRSGGGKGENIFEEIKQVVRSKTTKPTSGQADAEALGGGRYTREANIKAADAGSIGFGAGVLLGGGATLGVTQAWYSQNDSPPTKKEASAFEKAFSKAHNAGKETFMFKGMPYTTDVRKGKAEGGEMEDNSKVIRGLLTALKTAESPKAAERIQEQLGQFDNEEIVDVLKSIEVESGTSKEEVNRSMFAEGGSSMLVPPEMDMPVDTFTPEEQANAESSQLPDDEMEEGYMDYVLGESLDDGEQEYLMGALESDPRLSEIFDKVVTTASEFSGAGEVEGPGTGVSDSIPARLSDGEFVVTEEATSEIGADNLQTMMDDAERKASGGEARSGFQLGGLLGTKDPEKKDLEDVGQLRSTDDKINQSMLMSNQVPSLRR